MPIITSWALTASTPAVATRSCGANGAAWTDGINRLDWDAINVEGVEPYENKALFLQRSSVDNNKPNQTHNHYIKAISGLPLNPDDDSFWTTIKAWRDAEIAFDVFPTFWTESVPHSTFYYYRLVLMAAHSSSIADELDSNVATIVQPFDLSICTTDACVIPQNCRTLIWDAPVFTVPFITGTHVGTSECGGANGCFKIHVNWTYTPAPISYDIYKSNVGSDSLVLVGNTATSPLNGNNDWYDSDLNDRTMWYQFRANRPNGSIISSNIVQISY